MPHTHTHSQLCRAWYACLPFFCTHKHTHARTHAQAHDIRSKCRDIVWYVHYDSHHITFTQYTVKKFSCLSHNGPWTLKCERCHLFACNAIVQAENAYPTPAIRLNTLFMKSHTRKKNWPIPEKIMQKCHWYTNKNLHGIFFIGFFGVNKSSSFFLSMFHCLLIYLQIRSKKKKQWLDIQLWIFNYNWSMKCVHSLFDLIVHRR